MQHLNRPMRVMHIISGDLWAGAEVQAYTLLKHLASQVDLYVILMNQGELADRLTQIGITPHIIPEDQHSSLGIILKTFTAIRQFKPDVIHTHRQKENILTGFANLLTIIIRGRLTPSVRTTHGAPEFNPKGKQKIQVWLDRFTGRWLQKKVIAVSQDLSKKLEAIFPVNHLAIIPNGIDQESLRQQATTADFRQKSPDKIHIGIIGRLEPVKRIDIFLEMAVILLKTQSQIAWQFHIIGDGKLRNNLEGLALQLGIASHVNFYGHRKDTASCIASLDAIIMCSDHEGTPMTALEALALGTPLIAHDVGGLSEILEDYPQALVKEQNAIAYADKMTTFFSTPQSSFNIRPLYLADKNATATLGVYFSACGYT